MSPVVLVTGAARRLGAAIARALHARGYRLALHYHKSHAAATDLAAQLNAARDGSACAIAADLATPQAPQAVVDDTIACYGRLDLLINNAAVFPRTVVEECSLTDWEGIFDVNLKAPFFLTQASLPWLRANAGNIVNIADVYAERPKPEYPLYSVSKASLVALTRALARELAPEIRVNAVAPGAILWADDSSRQIRSDIVARTPLQRRGDPDDIAAAVSYLASARFVTGEVITVDGGQHLYL